jgi:hypothetical protein
LLDILLNLYVMCTSIEKNLKTLNMYAYVDACPVVIHRQSDLITDRLYNILRK